MQDRFKKIIKYNMGRLMADARRHRDLSQEGLAERAGVHRNTIAQIECGLKDARIITLTQIFVALNMGALRLDPRTVRFSCDKRPSFTKCPSESSICEQIACAVDFLRSRMRVSRDTIQEKTGVHRNTIASVENGCHAVRLASLVPLYLFFGINEVDCVKKSLLLKSTVMGTLHVPSLSRIFDVPS